MIWIRWGALMMFLGVAMGAFGAHTFKAALSPESKMIYQIAVLYHLVHGLGLLAVGLFSIFKPTVPLLRQAGFAFLLGIILFSGSLYLLSVTDVKKLGIVTPFGGLAFLIGWLCLALAAIR